MLADFIMECTIPNDGSVPKSYGSSDNNSCWVLHVDGASNFQKNDAGLILADSEGFIAEQVLRFNFNIFNNRAEYEALAVGLKMAKEFGVKKLKIFTDLQLIIG